MKWDPAKYVQFGDYRDRPYFDLTARIHAFDPKTTPARVLHDLITIEVTFESGELPGPETAADGSLVYRTRQLTDPLGFFAYAVAAPKPAVPSRDQKAKYFKHYLAGPGGLVGLAAVAVDMTR